MAVVETFALTKRYGEHRGVDDLSFSVEAGEVFGLLGPNGAGKTTTIRLVLDLIRPTCGRVRVLGAEPRALPALRRRIGYLPGDLRLYDKLTGRELLTFFAGLRRLEDLGRAEELARRLDVELDRPLRALSRGNRQKIGLVQAFMHDPDLLVLDEPTSGLDPLVQHRFAELLDEAKQAGQTVLLSSHVLPEVQELADRVALLRDGRLILVDTVEGLRRHAPSRVVVTFAEPAPPNAFAGLPGAREAGRNGTTVTFALQGEPDRLIKALARFHVTRFESREADLEDVFLSLYAGEARRAA
jgi:ABC-2 type transport system ATP-binding protein